MSFAVLPAVQAASQTAETGYELGMLAGGGLTGLAFLVSLLIAKPVGAEVRH
ncbi:hypothetical protein GUY60_02935 [Streptomyces sp. YC537]|uniref:Uncharacterized protein n=1 Tax=Streptomyces boluensis TaxID=1775135 RepID=A0A964UJN2_9ACTN|nr:hypothetical protein [Streptomyces boluensis]